MLGYRAMDYSLRHHVPKQFPVPCLLVSENGLHGLHGLQSLTSQYNTNQAMLLDFTSGLFQTPPSQNQKVLHSSCCWFIL